jgi:hypothetical protein
LGKHITNGGLYQFENGNIPGQQHLLLVENDLQQYFMVESGFEHFFLTPSRLRPRSAFLVSDSAVFRKTFTFQLAWLKPLKNTLERVVVRYTVGQFKKIA